MSDYVRFEYGTSVYRLTRACADAGIREIEHQRKLLERYIERNPVFGESLVPIRILGCGLSSAESSDRIPDQRAGSIETGVAGSDDASVEASSGTTDGERIASPVDLEAVPEIAVEMADAAARCGVGPMAAVAGAIAERAALAMIGAGAAEAVVDNGGDVAIHAKRTVIVGLYAGSTPSAIESGANLLALRFTPERLPCGVCSSSATMGHSLSLGAADLATVVADGATLADAAATRLCNDIHTIEDAPSALEAVAAIPGVTGALVVVDGRFAMVGEGLDLVRHDDTGAALKVTAHRDSDYSGRGGTGGSARRFMRSRYQ